MANFDQAFEVVMKHEDDPVIRGKITRNDDGQYADKLSDVPAPHQSTAVQIGSRWYYGFTRTRFGVDERAHPELRAGGFYSSMNADKAFDVAKSVFHGYWTFDAISDQNVATKIFDASINAGPKNAFQVVRRALASLERPIPSWQWGPSMLNAINACDAQQLLEALKLGMVNYYNAVAKNKRYAVTPKSWLTRANWVG